MADLDGIFTNIKFQFLPNANVILIFFCLSFPSAQLSASPIFTALDHPDSNALTDVWGIDGQGRIIGNYVGATGWPTYAKEGDSWIDTGLPGTVIGADQNNIIGNYFPSNRRGFLFNGTGASDIEYPGAVNTEVYDIDGESIVGRIYADNNQSQGFLYDGSSWSLINAPNATKTMVTAIDGDYLAGNFLDAVGWHGFLFNEMDRIVIDSPTGHATIWGGYKI